MIIIGIAGKGGSGKDTVGEILKEQHGFAITSFAWPIKKMICEGLLGVSIDKWDDREWRETPLGGAFGERTPRFLAQTLGTEWGRHQIASDLWLDLALERLDDEFSFVAITDLRFRNEADRIRDYAYGHIIHVHRAENEGVGNPAHPSEMGVATLDGDFHMNNFGTIEDLEDQVAQVVRRIEELQLEEMEYAADEAANEKVQGDADDPAGDSA